MGLTQKLGTIPLAIQTDSSNNVGIGGAANASYKLDVIGNGKFTSSNFPIDIYGTTNNYGLRINSVQAPTLLLYSSNANSSNRNWGIFTNSNVFGDFDIRQSNAKDGDMTVGTNSTSRLYIRNDGNVGIGTSNPSFTLQVNGGPILAENSSRSIFMNPTADFGAGSNPAIQVSTNHNLQFATNNSLRMTITNGGKVMVNTTDSGPNAYLFASANMNQPYPLGAKAENTSQGLVGFFDNGNNTIGSISRTNDVVSYNSFLGSHWSQLQDDTESQILKGTVLDAIDELCEWEGEINDRLAKVKISDTVESKNVYGVFLGWDNMDDYNDMYVAALGAGYIRVNQNEVISMGDLLQSNGDGTAKVQSDDIIRSSTIAKVVSTQKIETYPDGSYLIAATLHCG